MNRICPGVVRSIVGLLILSVAACGGDSSGPPKAGPPAALSVVSGTPQSGAAGAQLTSPLVVKVTDASGMAVSKAIVSFSIASGGGSLSQSSDTTGADGTASVTWTLGSSIGAARVEARVQGLAATAVFDATVMGGAAATLTRVSGSIGNSAGGFDVGDSVAVKVTDAGGNAVSGATVSFAVTAGGGSVSAATRTTGNDGIARTAWTLGSSGTQTLHATAGSASVDISATAVSCAETSLAVGDVVTVTPSTNTCIVSTATGLQKYLIAVANTSATPSSFSAFRLRGAGGGTVTTTGADIETTALDLPALSARDAAQTRDAQASIRAHANLLHANLELLDRLAARRKDRLRSADANATPSAALPKIGDMLDVRIPKNFNDLCSLSGSQAIRARVVHVGARSIILEDSASALAGQFDDRYTAVGEEFDNVMFPILTQNFGNPLAMDAQTDNNGHIFMVFSPVVNTIQNGGIAGFVTSGDFFTAADGCPASNHGEYFYARVPTKAGPGFDAGTVDDWARHTRTVIIHEVKHITSFAEKFASPSVLAPNYFTRDQWLEESSAMLAEELFGRTIFDYSQRANVDYATSIFCEVRPTPSASWPQCQPAKPLSVFDHFIFLYDYASDPENTSAVGPVSAADFTFYGSGWMFLRWVIDNYATSESDFLRAMTIETQSPGTDNVAERTGKPFNELMSDFALAFVADDYPGFTPKDAKYSIASWNTRDIFAGMSADFSNQNFFKNPSPLKVRPTSFGKFAIDVSSLHGGGFAVFEVSGSTTGKELLEFKGPAGTAMPAELRVKVLRVE